MALQSKKQGDAKSLVIEKFNVADKYTQGYFTKFQNYYELYRSYLGSGKLPWRSNLFIPKTFEIIETVAPRIVQAQKTFKALPVEGMDVLNADAYTDLLKFQFQKTDMEDVIEEWVKETLIYGTGFVKVTWGKNDMPSPEVVDIYDIFPDPKARFLEEAKYVIHRVYRDIEDLEENPNYDRKAIERLKKIDISTRDNEERMQRLSLAGITADDGKRKRFEILEYWGKFEGKDYLIAVERSTQELLRCDESPYKTGLPFVVARDQLIPHELYGIGEIEPIESLQNELNDVRNQRMDNVKLALNKMWKVQAGGVQFEDELVSRPGGIIHETRQGGIEQFEMGDVTNSGYQEEPIIKSDMERTTGANTAMAGALVSPMGGTQGGVLNRTATAYQGSINQGDKRFNSKVNQIKRGLIKLGRKFLELDQQFMDKPQMIRILGKKGEKMMEVQPEDIKSNFDLTIEVEYLDEFQRMQQDQQIAQSMANVPGFDIAKFMVDSLERNGRKGVEQYMKPPPPPPPKPPEDPKVTYNLRGELMPDAVAQILDKREKIQTNPEVVAAAMRAEAQKEVQQQVDMKNKSADAISKLRKE